MKRALITSDLHLGDKIWRHRPINYDSYFSWEVIVQSAIARKCDAVILAGDLLDKQTNVSSPIHHLLSGLRKLSEANISVFYNQGQHEYQAMPWISLHDSVIHLDGNEVYYFGDSCQYGLSGRDFGLKDVVSDFLKSDVALKSDILVMHQVWLEFMGDICKPQGSFADVPDNVKYVITGDLHKTLNCKPVEGRDLTVLSPGSTHLRSVSEDQDKFVFIMDFDDEISVEQLALPTRRKFDYKLVNGNLDFYGEIDSLIKEATDYANKYRLHEELVKPIIRLTHSLDSELDVDGLEGFVAGRAHLFYKPVSGEVVDEETEETQDYQQKTSLIQYLDDYVKPDTDKELHDLCCSLLHSNEPALAIQEWVEKNND